MQTRICSARYAVSMDAILFANNKALSFGNNSAWPKRGCVNADAAFRMQMAQPLDSCLALSWSMGRDCI